MHEKRTSVKEKSVDAATKAKRKVEKLRRQLAKEENRVAKAEAEAEARSGKLHTAGQAPIIKKEVSTDQSAEKKRRRRSSTESFNSPEMKKLKPSNSNVLVSSEIEEKQSAQTGAGARVKSEVSETLTRELAHIAFEKMVDEVACKMPASLTPTSQPSLPIKPPDSLASTTYFNGDTDQLGSAVILSKGENNKPTIAAVAKSFGDSSVSVTEASSEVSSIDFEDFTSSSGSSSSCIDSEDNIPDLVTSKKKYHEKVIPSDRARAKPICRNFLQSGLCKRGDRCKFRHELPKRGSHGAESKESRSSTRRQEKIGLYQRVSFQ